MNSSQNGPTLPPVAQANTQEQGKPKNTVGLIALILAILGFVFACIPGALIVGWILLPISFILSIVSLFFAGKPKKAGISALIISIIGTIIGSIVFIFVIGSAVDDALSGGEVTVTTPDGESSSGKADAGKKRENPLPLGSTIETDEWEITVHSVNLNANDEVAAENEFNDPPADGNVFILVNLTATYQGDDAEGSIPWATVDFVSSGGNTFSGSDSFAIAPDMFDSLESLYEGASTRGNILIEVPKNEVSKGVLAVSPELMANKVFVAIK